jgi:hypothetical protein
MTKLKKITLSLIVCIILFILGFIGGYLYTLR